MFDIDEWVSDALNDFDVVEEEGTLKITCLSCEAEVCTIDPGDSLGVLVRTAADHLCIQEQIARNERLLSDSLKERA